MYNAGQNYCTCSVKLPLPPPLNAQCWETRNNIRIYILCTSLQYCVWRGGLKHFCWVVYASKLQHDYAKHLLWTMLHQMWLNGVVCRCCNTDLAAFGKFDHALINIGRFGYHVLLHPNKAAIFALLQCVQRTKTERPWRIPDWLAANTTYDMGGPTCVRSLPNCKPDNAKNTITRRSNLLPNRWIPRSSMKNLREAMRQFHASVWWNGEAI